MTEKPKRRWFRFSLRTLFVVVTLLGCWAAYELSWIRQRHAVLPDWNATNPVGAPSLLWLFGEKGYSDLTRLTFDRSLTSEEEAELQRVKDLFPEAHVAWSAVPFTRGEFHGY